jgi:hypothetical protein
MTGYEMIQRMKQATNLRVVIEALTGRVFGMDHHKSPKMHLEEVALVNNLTVDDLSRLTYRRATSKNSELW